MIKISPAGKLHRYWEEVQVTINTSWEAAALGCPECGNTWNWARPLRGPGIYAYGIVTQGVAPRGPPLSYVDRSCLLAPELSLGGQRLTHYGVDRYLVAGRTPIKDDSRELPCGHRGFPPLPFLVSLLPSVAFLNLV